MDRQGLTHDAGRSLRCGRRSRRHHAGLRLGGHRWARSPSASSPRCICLWACSGLKKMLGYDDSLDVFGVHCVGGIVGAILTGVFNSPALGGTDVYDYVANAYPDPAAYDMGAHVISQLWGVGVTLLWSGVVSAGRLQAGRSHHRPACERRAGTRRPRHRVARRARLQRLIDDSESAGRARQPGPLPGTFRASREAGPRRQTPGGPLFWAFRRRKGACL